MSGNVKEVDIVMLGNSRQYCPYKNEEIWTCNDGYKCIPNEGGYFTKLFLMHKQVIKHGEKVFDWNVINDLQEGMEFEIVTLHKIKELGNTIPYPLKEICGYFHIDYFNTTHSYMLAYALYKGFKRINLYGCRFSHEVSREADDLIDKGCFEFWLGFAMGMGTEIYIVKEDELLKNHWGVPYALSGYSSNH